MGRINLAPIRLRKRALQNLNASLGKARNSIPIWFDVLHQVPPAQILTRQQPQQHPVTHVRTQSLPDSTNTQQYATVAAPRRVKTRKASRMFTPIEIKYEEDELRHRFFSDHPWELARPRIVLETDGDQYKNADWSTGIKQPGVPLSGESVIQRQLWLLQNVPDMDVPQSYDIARREFYMLRRAEETKRRIAREEAEHMGAEWSLTALQRSLKIENKMYDDWETWSRNQTVEQLQKNSAFAGETLPAEQAVLQENEQVEGDQESAGNARLGRSGPNDPFAAEARRRSQFNMM